MHASPRTSTTLAAKAPLLLASLCAGGHAAAKGRRRRGRQDFGQRPGAAGRPPARAAVRCRPEEAEGVDFEVTPWGGEVEPRPFLVVSDGTGGGARRLAESTWAQFGSSEAAQLTVLPEVRSAADVEGAVEQARGAGGALVVFTLAASDLNTRLIAACAGAGVPCVDALQPLLAALEDALQVPRLGGAGAPAAAPAAAGPGGAPAPVFAVSDSSGSTAYDLVRHALRQFPGAGVEEIRVCPRLRSLEEVRLVASEAGQAGGVVAFTFASTGMSRYMRQQCERAGARYVDLYQPVLLAMEIHLDYPSIGVPGGYSESLAASRQSWERRPA